MDIQKQKQLLTWIVIILVLLNLSVIGFLVFQNYKLRNDTVNYNQNTTQYNKPGRNNHAPGAMMNQRFNFNEAQREKLRESAILHRQNMMNYKDSIRLYRGKMMREIAQENPDSNLLNRYFNQIGKYHVEMNRATTRHFIQLKTIASPEQKEEIKDFMFNISERKEFGRPHHSNGHRQHHPMRNKSNRNW